jgi:hypothetical protein
LITAVPGGAHAQVFAPAKAEFQISKAQSRVDANGDVVISFTVSPSPDPQRAVVAVCLLAVAQGAATSLENLVVKIQEQGSFISGFQFKKLYRAYELQGEGGKGGAALVIQDLGDGHLSHEIVSVKLDYRLPGFPPRTFPTTGLIQIGMARAGTSGEPMHVLISNVMGVDLTGKQ